LAESKTESKFLTYKGRPLVRSGNTIYYGNMWEKYVVLMQIINTKKLFDQEIAGTVEVQLLSTDSSIKMSERIVKRTEKNGLYNALDIGNIWLERALSN
jgi:hypothetical protein